MSKKHKAAGPFADPKVRAKWSNVPGQSVVHTAQLKALNKRPPFAGRSDLAQLKGAALVAALRTAGYEVRHYEAQWADVGDAENGPKLEGHEAHDVWTRRYGDVVDVCIVQDGAVVDEDSYPAYMDEEGA